MKQTYTKVLLQVLHPVCSISFFPNYRSSVYCFQL